MNALDSGRELLSAVWMIARAAGGQAAREANGC